MAEVTRKGFKDKNGNKVSLIAKVINAITGHFAGLNNKGEVVDSGYGPSDFAKEGHSHSVILDASTESSISIDEGIISIAIEGEGSGGETEINGDNIGNLHRALQDPVKNSDPDSAYSNNKLITAAAVLNKLSGKLDNPDERLMVKFDVSGGALTLVSDTTEYNNIFGLVTPSVTKTVTTFVGIYNSDDDVYTRFLGVVSVNGQYSNVGDGTLLEINVTIYVGGYTIYLNKNVSSGTITVSMDSFAALLQNS